MVPAIRRVVAEAARLPHRSLGELLPVFLYGQLRFAQRLPVLIAGAVLLMLGTIALTLIITRLRGRED